MFPENTMSFEIKGMDIISPPTFIKFPRAILRREDIISVHIDEVDNGIDTAYTIIVNTKQKQSEEFCVAHYDSEEEAKATLDEVWQSLNPPLAYSDTIDAPDDVIRELKGETKAEAKTEKEDEPTTFDFLTAVKKLLEGNEVRVVSWPRHEYIFYDQGTKCIYDELGFDFKGMLSWADDVWEDYKDEVV